MQSAKFKSGRFFLGRLEYDSDVVKSITDFARSKKIKTGVFTLIGAVKSAKLAYYNQDKKEYLVVELKKPREIVSCIGNISYHKGKLFAHAHVVLADEQGRVRAGHLLGAQVFAAELHMQELIGPKLERVPDKLTGLALWKLRRG
ncbi:MAG: DNA-binding protein [Hadesarchaea archaeon]|nr:DNA-binding protein [Hadesarchaea archaeon]